MNAEQNILLLVNSRSGKGKAMQIAQSIQAILAQKNIAFTAFTDNWPETFETFTEIWLCGGDGTVNYFINKYRDYKIPLAIFKGGTGNDIAWKLYGEVSLAEQIESVLIASPKRIDAGICNDRLYVNSLGIGFDGEVLCSMNTVRWLGGHFGYLFVVIKKSSLLKNLLLK